MDVFHNTGMQILMVLFFASLLGSLIMAFESERKTWQYRKTHNMKIRWADKLTMVVLGTWFLGSAAFAVWFTVRLILGIDFS